MCFAATSISTCCRGKMRKFYTIILNLAIVESKGIARLGQNRVWTEVRCLKVETRDDREIVKIDPRFSLDRKLLFLSGGKKKNYFEESCIEKKISERASTAAPASPRSPRKINYPACAVTSGDVLLIGETSLTILSSRSREERWIISSERGEIRESASPER